MNLREIKKRAAMATIKVKKVVLTLGKAPLAKLDDFRKSSVTQDQPLTNKFLTDYKQLTSLTVAGALVFTSGIFAYQNVNFGPMEVEMADATAIQVAVKPENSVLPTETVKDNQALTAEKPVARNTIIDDRRIVKGKQPFILKTALADLPKYAVLAMDGFALSIDGREVGFFAKETDATQTLESFKKQFPVGTNVIEVYFKEEVSTQSIRKNASAFTGYQSVEQALALISKGTDVEKIHTVSDGESFWAISTKYNISVDELIKANPKIVPERIKAGDKVSLLVAKPLVTLCTVETVTYSEDIPFTTQYKDDASIFKGQAKVTTKGANGQKEITAKLVKENGVAVKRLVLTEKIVSNPKNQMVAKGTKKAPSTAATGKFAKPFSRGTYSSGFGRRWGRMHEGIDYSMPVGSPIYAADGGVVESSGTDGAYGKVIVINHGNGLKTVYAHNSKLLVSAGDKVYKGQKIAASGNTGRSTGPHLHFEVRKNGTPVNPAKYLK